MIKKLIYWILSFFQNPLDVDKDFEIVEIEIRNTGRVVPGVEILTGEFSGFIVALIQDGATLIVQSPSNLLENEKIYKKFQKHINRVLDSL